MADASMLVSIVGHETVSGPAAAAASSLSGIEGAAGRVGGALTGMAATAIKATAAVAAIGAGIAAAGLVAAVKSAADFEKSISAIGAVANLSAAQMKSVSAVALQIGKDTKFGAAEAATGIEELIKAGVSVEDVMAGAARSTADLAAASGTDLKTAAEIASNAMNVFNKSGADMASIANTITGATNASAIDINDFKFSLAAAGAVAATVGITFEDLSTGIALMGNAGIKGSDAGTSLKTMLLNLQPSTKAQQKEFERLGITTAEGGNAFFTAEGKAKSLAEIAGVLQTATAGMTQQQKLASLEILFGTDAIRAAAIMTEAGAEGFANLGEKMAGMDAGEQGRRRLDNLAGSLEQLGGTWDTVKISMGRPFLPVLKKGVDELNAALGRAEPTITAFAERAAAGVSTLMDRAKAAAPAVLAAGAALLAFGRTLVTLAGGPLLKLGNELERLRAFFLGGEAAGGIASFANQIQTAFETITPIVMAVGQGIATHVIDTFTFLTQTVLPPVLSILQQTGDLLMSTLLPAAQQTGTVMRTILGDSLSWLSTTVWPPFLSIVKQTSDFFTGVILPTLPAVSAALRTALGETVQWLATDVWPRLTVAATAAWGYISGTIIPALPAFAAQLRTVLGGALQWVGTTGWPMLVAGATVAWAFLNDKIIPVVKDVISWLKEKLPPAIASVTAAWETLRGKVEPIITAVFEGDIKAALSKLGTAFSEFATLAMGWLGEQVGTIVWEDVWNKATAVVEATSMWFADAGAKFATWIGDQVADIKWDTVWAKAKNVIAGMADWFTGIAGQFVSWIGTQVAKIKWDEVWGRVSNAIGGMVEWFADVADRFTTWIGEQVGEIRWEDVWARATVTAQTIVDAIATAASGVDAALTTWLNTQIEAIQWAELGAAVGRGLIGTTQAGVDQAGAEAGTLNVEGLKTGLLALLVSAINGAWTQALENWRTLAPGESYAAVFVEGIDKGGIQLAIDKVFAMSLETQKTWALAWLAAFTTWASDQYALLDTWANETSAKIEAWEAKNDTGFTTWIAGVGKILSDGWDAIWARAGEALDAVWATVTQKGADIAGAFTTQVAEWVKAGTDMAAGLVKAVSDGLATLVETVIGPIRQAIEAVRGMLPGGGGAPASGGAAPSSGGGSSRGQHGMPQSYTGEWEQKAYAAAVKAGIDPIDFVEQMRQESGLNPNTPASGAGAQGIAQIVPRFHPGVNTADPEESLAYAANLMAQHQRTYGDPNVARAAYNAGPGAVATYGGVPPFAETQLYNQRINANAEARRQEARQGAAPQTAAGGPEDMVTIRSAAGSEMQVRRGSVGEGPGQYSADPSRGGYQIIGQQAAQAAGQATRMSAQPFNMSALAIGNQFELGLPFAAAAAACGPAAAAIFLQATGRTPNASEVMRIAAANGWTAGQGMSRGPAGFMGMLGELGIGAAITTDPGAMQGAAQGALAAGGLAAISTGGGNVPLSSGHYFVAQGFNQETQQYDLGETGGPDPTGEYKNAALKGGSRFMTMAEIEALAGKANAVITLIDQIPSHVETATGSFTAMSSTAGSSLSAIGASIDPVVASFTEGTTSVGTMTDAIILSAASQGVATTTAAAYAQGLTTQDVAMRAVLAAYAETTPAAAILLAQLDAGTISTDQAAIAFAGMATTTAVATGALSTMGAEGLESVRTLATGSVGEFDLMKTGVLTASDLMNTGVVSAADLMRAGVLTAADLMEDGTLTATGQMKTKAVSAAELMNQGVVTNAQVMQAEAIIAADTMYTEFVAAADRMNTETVAAADTMVGDFGTALEGLDQPIEDAVTGMEAIGEVEIPAPDISDVLEAMKEIEKAAKEAEEAASNAGGGEGEGGGGDDEDDDEDSGEGDLFRLSRRAVSALDALAPSGSRFGGRDGGYDDAKLAELVGQAVAKALQGNRNNYVLNMTSNAPVSSTIQDYAILEAMGREQR